MKIDVYVVNNNTVRFRIKDERTRARVLRRGMWNLCGVPVVLSKWTPIVDMEQEEVKIIPLWVIVKNVLPKCFSWEVLKAITSPLGVPQKLHPDTEACKSFEEAKVLVEVDLTKKLPKFFSFKSERGGDTIVESVYPWLPPRCTVCEKWGHQNSDCLGGKKKNMVLTKVVAEKEQGEVQVAEEKIEQQGEQRNEGKNDNANAVVNLNATEQRGMREELLDGNNKEWNTPTKVGRSPIMKKDLKYGEVSILTNSFSCLSNEGEEEEIPQEENLQDTQIEELEDKGADISIGEKNLKKSDVAIKSVSQGTEGVMLRQTLPRVSKDEHRYLSTNTAQGKRTTNPNTLKTRKHNKNL